MLVFDEAHTITTNTCMHVDRITKSQRIAVANKAIRKKHKIKEAMEKMRATNNFHGIDALL